MTVRMASCDELAKDRDAIKKMTDLYWRLEKSATPVSLLLPWFPGSAKRNKKEATTGLYNLLSGYIDLRRKAEVPSSDAFDLLIAQGEENPEIVGVRFSVSCFISLLILIVYQFILSVIFAGVINTGIQCKYLLKLLPFWYLICSISMLGVTLPWYERRLEEKGHYRNPAPHRYPYKHHIFRPNSSASGINSNFRLGRRNARLRKHPSGINAAR